MKEKDNQLELARSKLNAVQAQTYTSEGTLTSLEEALTDRDKQGRDSVPIPVSQTFLFAKIIMI